MPHHDNPQDDSPGNSWRRLDAELAAWAASGHDLTLWWRDDDASGGDAAFQRLIELHCAFALPLTLAVTPRMAVSSLAGAIARHPAITPVSHGYAHVNHAPPLAKQAEFGAHRPLDVMLFELEEGMHILRRLFAARLQPVLIPPWNRIAPDLIPLLPRIGVNGLSAFQATRNRTPAPGLVQTNCHIDFIDWRSGKAMRPARQVLDELIRHLIARRLCLAGHSPAAIGSDIKLPGKPVPMNFDPPVIDPPVIDPTEPTGILTHHLAHSKQAWEFLHMLFARLSAPAGPVRWLSCAEVFSLPAAAIPA